jgi:hypothetical protein
MKKFDIEFQGKIEVEVDESDITEDESIEDIAINEFYNRTFTSDIEVFCVNSVEEI